MLFYKNAGLPRWVATLLVLVVFTATAYAQEATISFEDQTVSAGEAIRSIENQTGYKFSYDKAIFDTMRLIRIKKMYMTLREALDNIVSGTRIKYMVRGRYIVFIPGNDRSQPQTKNPPRTADTYIRNNPNALNTYPDQRPLAQPLAQEAPPVALAPQAAPEPEKEQYSDYRPIDIYADVQTSLPRFAIKTNVLYGLSTLTPNLSLEAALSNRSTVELSYSVNPWKYKADLADNRKLLHGIVSLEYRYWFCERYNGHYLGIGGLYSEYNISEYNIPILFEKEYRYKGNAYGGGVHYGYALALSKIWNVEFTAGVDVLRLNYDRYSCNTCDTNSTPFNKTHLVPSAGIKLVLLIK